MGFRDKVKKNVPKVELQSITTLIAGGFKSGKTRLWKELTELHYDSPEDALLLAFEDGYETWELENIIPLHEEGTDKTLYKVWDFFKKEVVPGLLEEAKKGRITKLIGVDTVDRAIDACTAWILYDRGKRYGKVFSSLQDISESTGGKENGWVILFDELKKPFDTLKNAGYGLLYIAWTKEKETTLYDGSKYNSVQLMMSNTGRKVFESQSSLICCLFNETSILNKNGEELEENIKDKKGKDTATNFHDTKTMMYFRPSDYIEIAGGRYTNLPEKVEYGAENFLNVFKEAVEGQLNKTKDTVDELKKTEQLAREDKVKTSAEKLENDPDELLEKVNDIVKDMVKEQKIKAASEFKKEFGTPDYHKVKGNVEQLKKALEIVTELTK
jgi:hypothetical protein